MRRECAGGSGRGVGTAGRGGAHHTLVRQQGAGSALGLRAGIEECPGREGGAGLAGGLGVGGWLCVGGVAPGLGEGCSL